MRKLFTLAMAAMTLCAAQAKDFVVYDNGSITPGLQYYNWHNANVNFEAEAPESSEKCISFKSNDGSGAASWGLNLESAEQSTGELHSATLNFSWYATGAGEYTIRLKAVAEENYTFKVTPETANKWNTTSLNVSEKYPTVAKQWEENASNGVGYVFSAVFTGNGAEDVIYFKNIYYSDIDTEWVAPVAPEIAAPKNVPASTLPASDVFSIFGPAYPQQVGFNIGGWGQTTQTEIVKIDDKDVYLCKHFNYLGWELASHINISEYTHMHVEMWTPDGEKFGFTPISPGAERGWLAPEVKKEEWNIYDVELTYFNNVNFSDIFQIKFDNGNSQNYYIGNVYFYKKEKEDPEPPVVNPGAVTGAINGTYEQTMNGETKAYPYMLDYEINYNEDKTLTIDGKYVWGENGAPIGAIPTMYILVNGREYVSTAEGGKITTAADQTFETGDLVNIDFKLPVAMGDVMPRAIYTVGGDVASGVEAIELENLPVEYYNLQGNKVASPERGGIYIRCQGGKSSKIVF